MIGWSLTPAIALAEFFDVPLVSTIHATEAGRHSGWVSGAISRQVHAAESWLVRESDSLITCSASMGDEIVELFGPGLAETHVIRNGIDSAAWPFARRTVHDGRPGCCSWDGWSTRRGGAGRDRRTPPDPRTHPAPG